jgi:hypothetical protein
MLLSVSNTKVSKNKIRTASFGLKAGKTCVGAGDCLGDCFAMGANYLYPAVINKQEERLQASKRDDFPLVITNEINELNLGGVRIHDAGDYYSKKYLEKWIEIAKQNPDVIFYSYTKSVHFFKSDRDTWSIVLPENLVVTFSYGGKYDHLINPQKDKHALVFKSLEQLLEYNYENNSVTDDLAYNKTTVRVGLIAKKYRKKTGFENTFNKIKDLIGG